ncbi:MAG: hypothetical protein PHE89_06445 [Alphaproteobacteria bacterium]|nr:hypothetical protein [Alphaproteobacteria bacterium]
MDIKNNQIKSMNERIKGLMSKNKELNSQLEQEPLEQQEQKIKQDKLDNNNELRKQRTQKYELYCHC